MVRHVIIWTMKDEYSEEEKQAIRASVKEGLVSIRVPTEGLQSSNGDLMLDSVFEDEEALKAYSVNPSHQAVANGKVRPYMKIRSCFDFVETTVQPR